VVLRGWSDDGSFARRGWRDERRVLCKKLPRIGLSRAFPARVLCAFAISVSRLASLAPVLPKTHRKRTLKPLPHLALMLGGGRAWEEVCKK